MLPDDVFPVIDREFPPTVVSELERHEHTNESPGAPSGPPTPTAGRRGDLPLSMDYAFDDLPLTPDAFRVYLHLARRSQAKGHAWPSYKSVGEHCFRHHKPNARPRSLKNRAERAVAELLEAGLITRKGRALDDGSQTSNMYWLTPRQEWPTPGTHTMPGRHATHDPKKYPEAKAIAYQEGDCASTPAASSEGATGGHLLAHVRAAILGGSFEHVPGERADGTHLANLQPYLQDLEEARDDLTLTVLAPKLLEARRIQTEQTNADDCAAQATKEALQ